MFTMRIFCDYRFFSRSFACLLARSPNKQFVRFTCFGSCGFRARALELIFNDRPDRGSDQVLCMGSIIIIKIMIFFRRVVIAYQMDQS